MADTNEQLALSWVRKEINKSLDQARQGLEAFAENDSDVTQIRFCISCLHQVRGTLHMLEFYGAALFAEEMEHLAQAIAEGKFVAKDKALEVLMTSMLQLPAYLDRVQEGRRDLPVILLPLLNELRNSRGAAPVSESAIFAPQLSGVEPPKPESGVQPVDPKAFSELAKKFRTHYQKGLLGVMRSQNVKEGIQRMHKVLEKLEEVTSGYPVAHLWWIADGFLFAIIENGLYKDPAIHALLGKIDRQIKRLADLGAEALNDSIPEDLLKNLLYYVAKSESTNERVVRLKDKFNLASSLPSDVEVEAERRRMQGPDSGAIETVVAAINDDLINVKDTLDLFVRGGDKSTKKIKDLVPNLQKITDTLGILGLGIPRDVIKQQINTLKKVVESGEDISDAVVMDVAGALLFVEANLANVKPQDVTQQDETSPEELAAKQDQVASETQFDEAKKQLLKASRGNLQKAKEKIVDFIASSFNFELITEVPVLLTEIQGGLQIVGFADASELLNKAQDFVERKLLRSKVQPDEAVMDALADIITSVEYCLENYGEIGSTAFDSVLNAAKDSQNILEQELAKPDPVFSSPEPEISAPVEPEAEQSAVAESHDHKEVEVAAPVASESVEKQPEAQPAPATPAQPPAVKAYDESLIDDEVLEIFLEEAEEELASINELFPKLAENADDEESLTTVRRSFHTLKGSGRLVGASLAGELAWSIENMLNRVIDGSIKLDSKVLGVMKEAIDFMPKLIDAFSKNEIPSESPDAIMAKAHAFAKGEDYVSPADSVQESAPAQTEAEAVQPEPAAEEVAPIEEVTEEPVDELQLEVDELPEMSEQLEDLETVEEAATDDLDLGELQLDEADFADSDEQLETIELELPEVDDEPELSEDFGELTLEESDEVSEPVGVDDVLEISEELDDEDIPTLDMTEEPAEGELEEYAVELSDVEAETDEQEASVNADIDPVLLEIFVTEAETHIDVMEQCLAQWDTRDSNTASDDLLRAMHTLKGSAYMAEVPEVADLAGPLELLVKEFKQRDIELTSDFKRSLEGTKHYLSQCIEALKQQQHFQSARKQQLVDELTQQREQLIQQVGGEATASISSSARDPELLGIFLAEGMDIIAEAKKLLGNWQQKGSLEAQHNLQAEMHTLKRGANMAMLPEVEKLAAALESFVSKPDQSTNDDNFYQLGSLALDRVLTLLNSAAAEQALPDPSELIDDLKAWHSKPVATPSVEKPASIDSVEEVSETIRPEDVHEAEDEIDEELLEFFLEEAEELVEEIEGNLNKWKANTSDLLPVNNLQRNLHTFKGSARMAGVMSGGNLAHALEDLYEAIGSGNIETHPTHFELSYRILDHFRTMLEHLRDQGQYEIDEALIEQVRAALENRLDEISEQDDVVAEDSVVETPEQLEVETSEVSAEADEVIEKPELPIVEAEVQQIELDEDGEEVLEIYLEEAAEILQSMDEALQVWSNEPTNNESIETIQRNLHTLKGGARLSNLAALGNLTHELETYFEKVADGQISVSNEQIPFVMRGYDVIQNMVDEVGASRMLTTPAQFMDELARVIKGEKIKPKAEAKPAVKPAAKADVVPIGKKKAVAEAVEEARRPKQQEVVRIGADQLESLVNLSGETSIFRARLEQQVSVLRYNLDEMTQALDRLREQLRNMEIETDAQIEYRREIAGVDYEEFDPLEFDRYTRQQELTRSLGESAADISSLKEALDNLASDAETLLLQQGRVNTEMQERLMRTRMVPFDSLVPRLRRIVRQIGNELGKAVDLSIVAEGEMDRTVLERMIAPIEHMLRNAMDHGIETTEEREAAGKPETGKIRIRLYREGSEIFIEIQDDGRGLNIDAIRSKALERGLITEHSELSNHELQQMIFEAGFSTAQKVTQISGRGVGMDVVSSEIKQMGGVVEIHSEQGKGATFTVKLPFTVSVNQALMIRVGEDFYAIPLTNIEGIVRVSPFEIQEYYDNPEARFEYAGMPYHMRYMGNLIDHNVRANLEGVTKPLPVLLLHGAEHPTAVQVDELMGSREIVVKTVGQQLSLLSGLSGATILGDGRVVLILDVPALTRRADAIVTADDVTVEEVFEDKMPTIMVVDDSITVRKVTQRLLQRHDYEVLLAKDGVDALSVLHDHKPDVMLLDIEMPRMDGFELATIIRHDDKLKNLPIIMITSRTGEKHRERAESIGVNRYMGKPYNEVDLLQSIESLLPGKQ